jgi:hypothetical protein
MRAYIFSAVLVFSLLGGTDCFKSPSQLQGQHAADCSTPTRPKPVPSGAGKSLAIGPGYIVQVVEVYDFEQQLIAYAQSNDMNNSRNITFGDSSDPVAVKFSWNGKDLDGNQADPGKYIFKISIIDSLRGLQECRCTEVFVAP